MTLEQVSYEELCEEVYILTQPTRLKIINALRKAKKPLFIEQIAEAVGEDRRSVSFHLTTLAEYGFVKGEYKVSEMPRSKGKAAKYYQLTEKVDDVFSRFSKSITSK